MLIQFLSAKLGLVTGSGLAETCRDNLPRFVSIPLWLQAEAVAMATDLAEVLGGAVALWLLFDLPLTLGGVVTGVVAVVLAMIRTRRPRRFERVVCGLLLVVLVGFGYDLTHAPVEAAGVAGGLLPRFEGTGSVLLAAGILGATVMPHAVYVHSALTTDERYATARSVRSHRYVMGWLRTDIGVAMGLAGLINAVMLIIAAALFSGAGTGAGTLEQVHDGLGTLAGETAATAFALALLASGFASSGVGTYAGQVIMEGFLHRRIPLWLRRLLTLAPAMVVLAAGLEPTRALVMSQVVLSFGIPFALIPLVMFTASRRLMGEHANRPPTTLLAAVTAASVIVLNGVLLRTLFT
ncbi:Nramp family divalent metal transporter [Dactylosporangium roseum]